MSTLRHRFRIVVDGEKLEVTTSARDMAAADIGPGVDLAAVNMAEQTFKLIHAACLRMQLPGIPTGWQEFADLLDDIEDLDAGMDEPLNPTLRKA
jgi:hypothetical protein